MAVHDGRLELDDDGHVVDAAVPLGPADAAPDVVEHATDPGALGRAGSWARGHPLGAAFVGAVTVALLAGGALVVVRPGAVDRLEASVEPVARQQQAEPRVPLVGEYRLTTSTTVSAVGLVGPGVRSSTAVLSDGGALEVTAVPDCDDPTSLDEPAGTTYAVELVSDTSSALVPLPTEGLDWASELRRACWLQRAATGLDLVGVAANDDPSTRRLVLDLELANGTGRPVQVRSADGAGLQGADVAELEVGATGSLQVRVPVTACRPGRLGPQAAVPARLSLSVGPPGSEPVTDVAVYLTPEQRASVAALAARGCGTPPDVTVRVLDAAPADVDVDDTTAAGVDVSVAVDGRRELVVLGLPGPGFTAEARREFGPESVRVPGTASLLWTARCESAAAPVLPLAVQRDGITWSLRVLLDDADLLAARAAACAQRDRA